MKRGVFEKILFLASEVVQYMGHETSGLMLKAKKW